MRKRSAFDEEFIRLHDDPMLAPYELIDGA